MPTKGAGFAGLLVVIRSVSSCHSILTISHLNVESLGVRTHSPVACLHHAKVVY